MSAFSKYIPSVFVICSPLQLLCALAAIKQLEISDYKMIVYLPKGDVRNLQVKNLLKDNGVKYNSFTRINKMTIQFVKLYAIFRKKRNYARLFVGDIKNITESYIGYCFVSDNSDVVYLDDGNGTISLLKNEIVYPTSERNRKILEYINKHRGIRPFYNLLSIYTDIPNPKYNIKELHLNLVVELKHREKEYRNIYIVGTNIINYCAHLGISEELYINKLSKLMDRLKRENPDEDVIFIPHGREKKKYGEQLCKDNGCIFQKPEIMIELELIRASFNPKIIYGYTSAALFTLKKLFPGTRIVNILFDLETNDNKNYKEYIECSNYFEKNGIELYREPIQ